MKRAPLRLACGLVLALCLAHAQAGRSCDEKLPQAANVAQGLELAERTARALDASGAEVVLLARAGQDLSKHGLRWSHLGFAYREAAPAGGGAPGVWRVVHKLNHCGSERAGLYRQGLGEFFLDDPHRFEAAYAVLAAPLAAKLAPLLRNNQALQTWHEPHYSLVSYAWATRYQQSNQWLLETLAGAAEPGNDNRARAQAWLRQQGYQPNRLKLGTFTRLGARLTRANIAFDDHPNEQRFAGRIDTVGADSVFEWLQRSALAQAPRLVP